MQKEFTVCEIVGKENVENVLCNVENEAIYRKQVNNVTQQVDNALTNE